MFSYLLAGSFLTVHHRVHCGRAYSCLLLSVHDAPLLLQEGLLVRDLDVSTVTGGGGGDGGIDIEELQRYVFLVYRRAHITLHSHNGIILCAQQLGSVIIYTNIVWI